MASIVKTKIHPNLLQITMNPFVGEANTFKILNLIILNLVQTHCFRTQLTWSVQNALHFS